MGERIWTQALTDVEVVAALIQFCERERKTSLPVADDDLCNMLTYRQSDGRWSVVIYADKKDPPRIRKPFRWPWSPSPHPQGAQTE